MQGELKLTIPCRLEFRAGLAQLLAALCQGLREREIHQIVSAFNEAFSNIVFHSQLAADQPVEVSLRRDRQRVEIFLVDGGIPYTPVFDVDRSISPAALQEHGMGLPLIGRCMDDVSYERTSADRNALSMVKLVDHGGYDG